MSQSFFCPTDHDALVTNNYLKAACSAHGVAFTPLEAAGFDYLGFEGTAAGDLVYRVDASPTGARLEQYLVARGAVSFHATVEHAMQATMNPLLLMQQAGLPIIPTVLGLPAERGPLLRAVEHLGGLPVVVKVLGGSYGRGVMRADSLPALFSLVDYLQLIGQQAYLMRFVPHVHHRFTVLGGEAIAAYRKPMPPDDFRTSAHGAHIERFPEQPDPALGVLAVRATAVHQLEFGGVDVLVDVESGAAYVAEVNYPCYFARAQAICGVDIAGMMIEYLARKARGPQANIPNQP